MERQQVWSCRNRSAGSETPDVVGSQGGVHKEKPGEGSSRQTPECLPTCCWLF